MPRIVTLLLTAILLLGCKRMLDQKEAEKEKPTITSPTDQKADSLRLSPAKREQIKSNSDSRKKDIDSLLPVST
ncbi:MAG: hypothetical protein HKN89_03340 [Eudoraea sp.]|nr:hypothetical protein [Eudoraea sp.]